VIGSQNLEAGSRRRSAFSEVNEQSDDARLQTALARTRDHLLARQKPDGHWVGELQGDTILETEYILLLTFLGREDDERVRKAARYILQQQRADGGWSIYPGGPIEISASVKAYFALKLAGHNPGADYMRRAREVIRSLGGAARCNSFTKFYLALLGQIPYHNCASVPPEMMLLPRWFYFNIYAMSSWTRTIVIPLSIFYAFKPVRPLKREQGIAELFLEPPETPMWVHPPAKRLISWHNFFLALDRCIKWFDRDVDLKGGFEDPENMQARGGTAGTAKRRLGVFTPLLRRIRSAAVRRAADWMIEHFADSDGVGAIFPPMIYTAIALRCLGYRDDSPEMIYAMQQLDDLMIEEGHTLRLQPCMSPVWDTALTLNALADSGLPGHHAAVTRAVDWLLKKEVRRKGDWSIANPTLEPSGWFFEYRNGFYPDVDDTAMVLMALAKYAPTSGPESVAARQRGLRWLLAMQNQDGGWAAFDRDINREVLTKVPFADHNAMLDPSCPDITARVLEALGYLGYNTDRPQLRQAFDFLERTQESEGCWIGRWGVNYLYGTWQVLQGLQAIGYPREASMVRKAVEWLNATQQPGGGWGETCRSYDDPSLKGQGQPTASQTAWALLGLLAAGEEKSSAVRAGIQYLLDTQRPEGDWHEDLFTGTGFPKVFYLKYHLYSVYFPLMALSRYARAIGVLERVQTATV
jgi:squalene-hopene/tetraprenyl-beta-curcumene cyclase